MYELKPVRDNRKSFYGKATVTVDTGAVTSPWKCRVKPKLSRKKELKNYEKK